MPCKYYIVEYKKICHSYLFGDSCQDCGCDYVLIPEELLESVLLGVSQLKQEVTKLGKRPKKYDVDYEHKVSELLVEFAPLEFEKSDSYPEPDKNAEFVFLRSI